ncbi:MAG: SgcJ/EcaC family oxidoreductase [Methylobacter sp.]|nr:SgcJ/EcaC family oxidoreductase [Methylobacter sp.]
MTTHSNKAIDEASIRELIDNWANAFQAKDINKLMAHYAPEIVVFDIQPPLEYRGTDAYRKNWEEWLPSFQGLIEYEIRDLSITTGDDVAFSHSLNRITGTKTNGEHTDGWLRVTVCYRKIDGKWLITHEHISVPLYMDGSGRAATDLEPNIGDY